MTYSLTTSIVSLEITTSFRKEWSIKRTLFESRLHEIPESILSQEWCIACFSPGFCCCSQFLRILLSWKQSSSCFSWNVKVRSIIPLDNRSLRCWRLPSGMRSVAENVCWRWCWNSSCTHDDDDLLVSLSVLSVFRQKHQLQNLYRDASNSWVVSSSCFVVRMYSRHKERLDWLVFFSEPTLWRRWMRRRTEDLWSTGDLEC